MSKMKQIAEMLLGRDEDDPFGYYKVRSWNKHAKSVDAMPDGIVELFKKKKKTGAEEDPECRIRAANSVPEAMVKVASYGAGAASAKGQLDYVSRDGQLELELSDGTVIQDKEELHALVDEWETDFHYRKGGSRNTMHMVVSAPNGSDPEGVLNAGREFAEAIFGDNHPYALVRHDDGDHPHVHIIVKMRGNDGEMFRIERGGFQELRETFAEKCRDNGIEMNATSREMRGTARSEPMGLRKMREEGRTPEIDTRAAKLVAQERELPETARAAMQIRQVRLNEEAKQHRAIASALSSMADTNTPEGRTFESEAEKLRELAGFLEEGGRVTRPERMRNLRDDRMADRQMDDQNGRPDPSKDGRDREVDPIKVLDEARLKADRGVELARKFTDKLPPGEDRARAEAALADMSRVADSLHGREQKPEQVRDTKPPGRDTERNPTDAEVKAWVQPEADGTSRQQRAMLEAEKTREPRELRKERQDAEILAEMQGRKDKGPTVVVNAPSEPEREMKAGALDKNFQKDRSDASVSPDNQPEKTAAAEAPAPGSMKEFMAKKREREAEQARERERNPEADRDR